MIYFVFNELRGEMVGHFVICVIVDHHCVNFLVILF